VRRNAGPCARISGSFVIGRNTAFSYKGKHVDLKQIGRELNVRYVLEGNVQRSGNRLRVNVQLIDAQTSAHLWAERFDRPVADLFERMRRRDGYRGDNFL
jgi:TolB-like protein